MSSQLTAQRSVRWQMAMALVIMALSLPGCVGLTVHAGGMVWHIASLVALGLLAATGVAALGLSILLVVASYAVEAEDDPLDRRYTSLTRSDHASKGHAGVGFSGPGSPPANHDERYVPGWRNDRWESPGALRDRGSWPLGRKPPPAEGTSAINHEGAPGTGQQRAGYPGWRACS
jgi:hypothetical protein